MFTTNKNITAVYLLSVKKAKLNTFKETTYID